MARSTASDGDSPLQRWRQQKDKVLEADSVESEYLPAGPALPAKTLPSFSGASPSSRGGSGDLGYVPIQAPGSKGEPTMIAGQARRRSADPTMVPIQAPGAKGEATMVTDDGGRPAGEATMMPGQSRDRSGAQPTMTPGRETPAKGEATMMPGQSRDRPSAPPTMTPGRPTPAKGEATMMPGQSRNRPSAPPTMTPGRPTPAKGEATMVSAEAPPLDAGPTMVAGETRAPSADSTMVPDQSRRPSADSTMVAGETRRPSAGPTMIEGERRRQSAPPTMVPIQAPRSKGEATMIPGQTRRPSAPPTMVPSAYAPRHPAAASGPEPAPDGRAVSAATVNTFIDELRLIASGHGMDFSIIQPDAMKIDFFTDTKALRVIFTGREIAIDRVVVSEVPAAAPDPASQSGSARRRMLEWERQGIDAGRRSAKLRVATVTDPRLGALKWHDPDAPGAAKAPPPKSRVAIEARYFDTDDGRNWLIELVNGAPGAGDGATGDAGAGELTSDKARRLVMLLLNIVRSITAPGPTA